MMGLRLICLSLMLAVWFFACSENPGKSAFDTSAFNENLLTEAPTSYDVTAGVRFDDKIELLGLNYEPKPLRHGEPYTVTFYFKVLQTPKKDWEFFGHFEPALRARFRDKMDHLVLDGRYPTSKWREGVIIKDVFRGKVSKGFPGTRGVLWGGFFSEETRMPISQSSLDKADDDGRAKLAVLPLDSPPELNRKMNVLRTSAPITIDGKLEEKDWERAKSTGRFGSLTGDKIPAPSTEVRLLWDDVNLYIAFICDDTDIWTSYSNRDDPLYREETTEIMIDADGSGSTYYEIQVNAVNAVYDAYFPKRRKNMDIDWDSQIKSAVSVDGTVNKRDDHDRRWIVEAALPLSGFKDAKNNPPKPGDSWRINFYRMERPKGRGTIAAMWSPTLVGDFHTLGRFGTMVFKAETAETK